MANDVNTQLQSLFGWDSAIAWAHTSVQLMNGHADQPSELFTRSTFTDLTPTAGRPGRPYCRCAGSAA